LEIIHNCGLARNGRLKTSHGIVKTPTIFPVHDLGASSGWNTPNYWKAFPEINTAMFNASLIKTDVRKRLEAILKKGVHKYAGYKGIAFLDSGGWIYTKHNLGYTQEEILRLQERIGADIASSLDFPVRLMDGPSNHNITASIHNAMWAAKNKRRDKMLIFASIHGSVIN
jgi:queuine/archaeosine tRNA-ribosyltransferase